MSSAAPTSVPASEPPRLTPTPSSGVTCAGLLSHALRAARRRPSSPRDALRRWGPTLLADGVPLVQALVALATLAYVVALRAPWRGELEWMEGGSLAHVLRVLRGQPLYVAPSLDFIPFIYPPLYYWLSAGVAWLVGPHLLALRLVSIGATLGSFTVLALAVRRHAGGWLACTLSVGLFAATYRLSGAWFDVARVDALHTFLTLTTAYALVYGRGALSAALAGVALCAATLTKQSALTSALVFGLYALSLRSRRGALFLAVAVPLSAGSWVALDAHSDGWFRYYAFELPRGHALLNFHITHFWLDDVWAQLAVPALLTCAALTTPRARGRRLGLACVVTALILPAWMARFHSGMYDNVLLPMHAALSLGLGCALASTSRQASMRWALAAGLSFTFWRLSYDVTHQVPSARDRAAALEDQAAAAKLPENTWAPTALSLSPLRAGTPTAHSMALLDVARADTRPRARGLLRKIERAIIRRELAAVVLPANDPSTRWLMRPLTRHYRRVGQFHGPGPRTGYPVRTTEIWKPKAPRKPASPPSPASP